MGKVKDQLMGDDNAMGNIVHSAHDPVCPLRNMSMLKSGCPQCNLINIARDDERTQACYTIQNVYDEHARTCDEKRCEGPDLEILIAAVASGGHA